MKETYFSSTVNLLNRHGSPADAELPSTSVISNDGLICSIYLSVLSSGSTGEVMRILKQPLNDYVLHL